MEEKRHDVRSLLVFASSLLGTGGLRADIARSVAEVLVDADLMGHDTHGLALLPAYLDEVSKGTIRFPLSEPVPVKLIEGIAKFRGKEAGESKKS